MRPSTAAPLFMLATLAGCGEPASAGFLLRELSTPEAPSFVHQFSRDTSYYMPESAAPGIGVLDYDGDGDLDIYAVDGSGRPGRLFRRDGDRYVDVTAASGLGTITYGVGVSAGDFDNDGREDLYLTSAGPDALYRNTKDGFVDVTASAGIDNPEWGTSATWIDIDEDGWLDLYVANYVRLTGGVKCSDPSGVDEYCGPKAFPGAPDRLYRNLGDGTFADISRSSGIARQSGRGFGVVALDADDDGHLDVYVANDGEPNFLWRNRGDGTFEELALRVGAAVNGAGQPEAGMGVASGDVDEDGLTDIFVTHLAGESNTLYHGSPNGGYVDETTPRGLHVPSLPFTGFGTAIGDLDDDGDRDIVVGNGRINRGPVVPGAADGFLQAYAEPNSLYLNDGTGVFEERSDRAPDWQARPGMSRGLVLADLDGDGGLDVLVAETGGPLRLFRNTADRGNWVGLSVVDPHLGGRYAIGARLVVWSAGTGRRFGVTPNQGYASSQDPRVHVGLGNAPTVDSLEVAWPDGGHERFGPLEANRYHVIRRGEGRAAP